MSINGQKQVKFALYTLPDLASYVLVGCTADINFNLKARTALGVDCGMESDAFVLRGKTTPGDLSLGSKFKGMAVATREGAQVTTPADGRVEFAGAFRSYGEVLILNAGGGYHVLLAGLSEITAGTGEFLRAGEPVGTMGRGPSSVTLLGDRIQDGRPVLYIEFRNNGEAVDSSPWWIDGVKEARG